MRLNASGSANLLSFSTYSQDKGRASAKGVLVFSQHGGSILFSSTIDLLDMVVSVDR